MTIEQQPEDDSLETLTARAEELLEAYGEHFDQVDGLLRIALRVPIKVRQQTLKKALESAERVIAKELQKLHQENAESLKKRTVKRTREEFENRMNAWKSGQ